MAWDEIRREIEYRLNLEAAHYKMRRKNELLPKAQGRFEKALQEGKLLQFEDVILGAEDWLGSLGRELNAA